MRGFGVESCNYCIFTKCKEAEGEMASLPKVNFMVLKEDKRRTGSCPLVCVKCGIKLNEDLPVKEYSKKKKNLEAYEEMLLVVEGCFHNNR